jgi:hypothetical protein
VSHLELVTIIVAEYDPAIAFFVDVVVFEDLCGNRWDLLSASS